jgi:hypothetical protein
VSVNFIYLGTPTLTLRYLRTTHTLRETDMNPFSSTSGHYTKLTLMLILAIVSSNVQAKVIQLNCTYTKLRGAVGSVFISMDTENKSASARESDATVSGPLKSDGDAYWFAGVMPASSGWIRRYQIDRNSLELDAQLILPGIGTSQFKGQCQIAEVKKPKI